MRTKETPLITSGIAFNYLIRWERNSAFTRFPCVLCDGWTEKQDPLAVAYAAGHVPLTADPTGEDAGMVCDQCVEAGPEPVAGRLEAEAERLELMATERRRAAQLRWSFPPDGERQRLEADVKAEGAAYDAMRTQEEAGPPSEPSPEWAGHMPRPSFLFERDVTVDMLVPGRSGAEDTCYPACPACASLT